MSPAKQTIPAYTERLYEVCDVFDVVAGSRGNRAVEADVEQLLSLTVKAYPKAAEVALGKARAAQLVARYKDNGTTPAVTYKAADDPFGGLGQRFLTLLAESTDRAEAEAWLRDAIAEMEADEVPDAAAGPNVGRVSSSGADSKAAQTATKAYDWGSDRLAAAFGADQVQSHRLKAASDVEQLIGQEYAAALDWAQKVLNG